MTKFYTKNKKVRPITPRQHRIGTFSKGVTHLNVPRRIQTVKAQPTVKIYNEKYYVWLIKHGQIGTGTVLWADPKVTKEQRDHLSKSFERLPPAIQNQVSELKIYSVKGDLATVGDYSFNAAGTWNKEDDSIRVFLDNEGGSNQIHDYTGADYIIAHEGGHALWDKLESKREPWSEKDMQTEQRIRNQVHELRVKKLNETNKKYEPEIEKLWNEHNELQEQLFQQFGRNTSLDNQKYEQIQKQMKVNERQQKKVFAKREKETQEIVSTYDGNKIIERLDLHRRPYSNKISDFQVATQNEGGLTSYSDSYLKAKKSTAYTENFAEATRIWYSASVKPNESQEEATTHPKTYKAFMNIINTEAKGHAVPLKLKPVRRNMFGEIIR